jgi:hypothetical protein
VNRIESEDNDRLARLVRKGLVRRACGIAPTALFDTKPPAAKKNGSAVRVLLEERGSVPSLPARKASR